MKIMKDTQEIYCGSLKECIEEITDGIEILTEVRRYIKRNGYCAISIGDDEYIIQE